MRILWLTFKDLGHPLAGGAEVVNEALAARLAADGHEVLLITGGFDGAAPELEHPDGYRVIRVGNRYTLYWQAYRYYRRHLRGWADLVIDEVNTVPFFAAWYVREPHLVFAHMLCREIWHYELPAPFSWIGYLSEPLYMRALSHQTVITVSDSTKRDLMRVGFKQDRIHIISQGLDQPGADTLPDISTKADVPTMLSLGAMRSMKRTLDQLRAYELAKPRLPALRLSIIGDSSSPYGQRVMAAIEASPYRADITYHGRVSQTQKVELMRAAHCITVTSIKEGWGLIVTECASQGTPAIVYDVDGLRDSVQRDVTGLITAANTPAALADSLVDLLSDTSSERYTALRRAAYDWSRTMTFDRSYQQFMAIITPLSRDSTKVK